MKRYANMLAELATQAGHQVLVIQPELHLGKLFGPYRYSGLRKYLGYLDKYLLFPLALRKQIGTFQPDLVHITDHSNAIYNSHTGRVPTLVTCHDLLQIRAAQGEFPEQPVGLAGRVLQNWIRRHLARSTAVVCVSRKTAKDFERITCLREDRISVIPNGLNYAYQPIAPEEARRAVSTFLTQRGHPITTSYLLHVGGGHWYKNRPGVLRIFAELRSRIVPSPSLIMVGPTLSTQECALTASLGIKSAVHVIGGVSNKELNQLYSGAVCLLFPSLEEGFGWPILEAQACGCFVATSNRPPMNEVLVSDANGVLFDPVQPNLAAETIAKALVSRGSHPSIQSQNTSAATQPLSYPQLYEKLFALSSGGLDSAHQARYS